MSDLAQWMQKADADLKEMLKGKRQRVIIEGDAFKMYKAGVLGRFVGQGFTIWTEVIPSKPDIPSGREHG